MELYKLEQHLDPNQSEKYHLEKVIHLVKVIPKSIK